MRSFVIFLSVSLGKLLNKQSIYRCFETTRRSYDGPTVYRYGMTIMLPEAAHVFRKMKLLVGCTVEVSEWINSFIPHFIEYMVNHPCWVCSETMLKEPKIATFRTHTNAKLLENFGFSPKIMMIFNGGDIHVSEVSDKGSVCNYKRVNISFGRLTVITRPGLNVNMYTRPLNTSTSHGRGHFVYKSIGDFVRLIHCEIFRWMLSNFGWRELFG